MGGSACDTNQPTKSIKAVSHGHYQKQEEGQEAAKSTCALSSAYLVPVSQNVCYTSEETQASPKGPVATRKRDERELETHL